MYARAVQQLPAGKDWLYDVKFDGYRCLAGKDSTGVTLWSRRGNRFTDQFPTIAKACEHLRPDTLLDGEIIALDANGRISFNQLQHHWSQAQTILFYAFDVIIHRGRRLVHVPLESRRELLSDVAADLKTRTPLICSLEIKGRSGNLRLNDIRELDNWVRDAIANENYHSKGVLVANLQCDEEPHERKNFIPPNCVEAAKNFQIANVTTTQLFQALVSHQKGELDRKGFWETVFSTNGVCELPCGNMSPQSRVKRQQGNGIAPARRDAV